MTSAPIYHLAEESDWTAAQGTGEYRVSTRGRTLEQVGFIHACDADQWAATRDRFYADLLGGVLLLEIDPDRLSCKVIREVGNPETGELFPHIYGPLPVAAVVAVRKP